MNANIIFMIVFMLIGIVLIIGGAFYSINLNVNQSIYFCTGLIILSIASLHFKNDN